MRGLCAKHPVSVCRSTSAFACPTPRKGEMMAYKVLTVCSLLLSACPLCDCEGHPLSPAPTGSAKDLDGKRPWSHFSAATFKSRCAVEKLNDSRGIDVAATDASGARRLAAVDDHVEGRHSGFGGGFREVIKIFHVCREKSSGKFDENHSGKFAAWNILERARSLYDCMKIASFRELDDFLSDEVIPITGNLDLVKKIGVEEGEGSGNYEIDILRKNWTHLAWERLRKLFEGYALKFHFVGHSSEGRGRRRDHRMFAMMMMGFMIMASILVPMGFQFLTVLGGKSLLMAKMALIMSAINGLKKIATSNVGYGLYHAAGPDAYHHDPHHHGFHDKIFSMKPQGQENLPFNLVI